MATQALELYQVTKVFKKDAELIKAVDSVNLVVSQGEMIVFLGPSGCGKTTTLRMIAGFELPSSGKIMIQGEDMTNVPVNKRGIGFVFQNYALFPHMSVYNNIGYGLKSRGEKDAEIKNKVQDALALVGLAGAGNRFPNQLSGGEQQRVALARVLVMEPKLLLMDEPLSNLDAKLRIYMRTEIRRIQKKLGITCLYVTHDQAEALTMADRIIVMNRGKVEQTGTSIDLYRNPQSLFVADFIGQANTITLPVEKIEDKKVTVKTSNGWSFSARAQQIEKINKAGNAVLVVRPEHIQLAPNHSGDTSKLSGTVVSSVFMGGHVEYRLDLGEYGQLLAFIPFTPGNLIFEEGQQVLIGIDPESAIFLPA